jgi:hypothetical protein
MELMLKKQWMKVSKKNSPMNFPTTIELTDDALTETLVVGNNGVTSLEAVMIVESLTKSNGIPVNLFSLFQNRCFGSLRPEIAPCEGSNLGDFCELSSMTQSYTNGITM